MGQRFLIDTNIMIYVFSNDLSGDMKEKMNRLFLDSFMVSVINKIEFLGWKEATPDEYQSAKLFLSNARVLPLDDRVVQKTIELKRTKRVKLPDAIIAATCLVHDLTLVTRNDKDFAGIERLKSYNPCKIEKE